MTINKNRVASMTFDILKNLTWYGCGFWAAINLERGTFEKMIPVYIIVILASAFFGVLAYRFNDEANNESEKSVGWQ